MTESVVPFVAREEDGPFGLETRASARLHQILAAAPVRQAPWPPRDGRPLYTIQGGIALIEWRGFVCRRESLWGYFFGGQASTVVLAQALAAADEDREVAARVVVADSPGGHAIGCWAAGDAVYESRKGKPLVFYADGMLCSAAFEIGCQAPRLYAAGDALLGCLGTYDVITDTSRAYENEGISRRIVRAGALKGAGYPGTRIGEAEQAEVQAIVDPLNDLLIRAVMRGRGLGESAVRALATGHTWVGAAAVEPGLIDGVKRLEDLMVELRVEAGIQPAIQLVLNPGDNEGGDELPECQRAEAVAQAEAQKEVSMSDTNKSAPDHEARLAALEQSLKAEQEKTAKLADELKASGETIAELSKNTQLAGLLQYARGANGAAVKVTPGTDYLDAAIERAFEKGGPEEAKGFIDGLPEQVKRGSFTQGTAAVPTHLLEKKTNAAGLAAGAFSTINPSDPAQQDALYEAAHVYAKANNCTPAQAVRVLTAKAA